ncbi:MAG TPA: LpxI family protein, partial [Rhodospirillales bacterium]|nr:LpxI family protein [Rhodospirillales bacterium]
GRPFFVIAFKNQTPKETVAGDHIPHMWVRLGAAGKAIKRLRDEGVEDLVMAGAIVRPSPLAMMPDVTVLKFFIKSGAAALGDDGLLSALVRTLETEEGFRVIGAESLLPEALAAEGVFGTVRPGVQALEDIQSGIVAARELGARDLGQGVVVKGGRVLDVEGKDGTDAMLERVRLKKQTAGEAEKPGGVLVKVSKPGQETRADLPAIGIETIHAVADAGLSGIAVEAGGALVVGLDEVVKAADRARLFVIGVKVPEGL